MTDEPTKDPSDEPIQPADSTPSPPAAPTPPTPSTEPAGVGFAALGQPSPPPAGPVGYQYDYSRIPQNRGSGSSVLLVGGIAFLLVLLVGGGAMFALGVGPFVRATPTSAPTLVFQPRPTAARATPTGLLASPAPSPTGVAPSAPPIDHPKAALLSHIPPQIAESCLVTAPDDPGAILAIAVCDADGGDIRVTYFLYATHESMFSAYSGFRFASQIEPDSGDCDDPATWPTENSYEIGDVTVGRLLCTEELSETSLYWTDDRLNILSQATHTKGDHERLVEFWRRDSGPDL